MLALTSGATTAAPLDALAIYPLDNGDATDSSGNGNDGTNVCAGGAAFTTNCGGRNGVGREMDSFFVGGRTEIDTRITSEKPCLLGFLYSEGFKSRCRNAFCVIRKLLAEIDLMASVGLSGGLF